MSFSAMVTRLSPIPALNTPHHCDKTKAPVSLSKSAAVGRRSHRGIQAIESLANDGFAYITGLALPMDGGLTAGYSQSLIV